MGYDFQRACHVETKKVVWVIGLILVSVVTIQYLELPLDRNGFLSLLSTSKGYFSSSNGSGDVEFKEREPSPKNNSSPLKPNLDVRSINSTENVVLENHSDELEMKDRGIISIAPQMESDHTPYKSGDFSDIIISPSIAYHGEETNGTNSAATPTSLYFARAPEKAGDSQDKVSGDISPSVEFERDAFMGISASPPSPEFTTAPMVSPSPSLSDGIMNLSVGVPVVASSPRTSYDENGNSSTSSLNGGNNSEKMGKEHAPSDEKSPIVNSPPPAVAKPEIPMSSVVTISEMNDMLVRSRLSSFSMIPLWPSAAEKELLESRFQIENAPIISSHPSLYAPIYRNLSRFIRSYELMEQKLKVYIYDYNDVKKPIFHKPRLRGIYASEGWFMKILEGSNQFRTRNPEEAHLFYLPFSSQLLAGYVYVRNSHSFDTILGYLNHYVDTIKTAFPFWNRTDGSDHFLVACHDWAPYETKRIMPNCIRALCNADVKEGFQFGKDVSLPETNVQSDKNPMKEMGGQPPSQRKILAFFAGQMHGYVRPILLKYWENKDPDMKIVGVMRKEYAWHMKNSKYCICAKGYEVNSPRVVEAIMYGCVPVIISDHFVPPFFEFLIWESFAVFVLEKDIPNLKNILMSISERRYTVMQARVRKVREHFLWHNAPVKYDIFHMILHSIWYNRVFRLSPT